VLSEDFNVPEVSDSGGGEAEQTEPGLDVELEHGLEEPSFPSKEHICN
jgi:hypothetical protein